MGDYEDDYGDDFYFEDDYFYVEDSYAIAVSPPALESSIHQKIHLFRPEPKRILVGLICS